MKISQYYPGFTIVEIIIVIVVIAILAAVTIVSYDGIQERSRDAARDSTVDTLKNALELYHLDHQSYPGVCPAGDGYGCDISLLTSSLVPEYIDDMPSDPASGTSMQYVRGSGNKSYALRVLYESRPICKTGVNVGVGWWGSIPAC